MTITDALNGQIAGTALVTLDPSFFMAINTDGATTAGYVYIGIAKPGTDTTASAWSIRKIDVSTPNVSITLWANGSASAVNAWSDRASLTYS